MKPKILNLGCGARIQQDCVNLDMLKMNGVDVVHDLNRFPYPFKDSYFDEIHCWHILEHLDNFHRTVSELHRITKPGGIIKVEAPYFTGIIWMGDPSHKIPFCLRTFDNYSTKFASKYTTKFHSKALFRIKKAKIIFSFHAKFMNFLNPLINFCPLGYERFFSHILPSEGIYFELEVIK